MSCVLPKRAARRDLQLTTARRARRPSGASTGAIR